MGSLPQDTKSKTLAKNDVLLLLGSWKHSKTVLPPLSKIEIHDLAFSIYYGRW
jgi:hypothetical protein